MRRYLPRSQFSPRSTGLLGLLWGFPLACAAASAPRSEPAVIPNPTILVRERGEFALRDGTAIVVARDDAAAERVGRNLAELIARTRGVRLPLRAGTPRDGSINLVRSAASQDSAESYRLEVRPRRITVSAADTSGLLYGGGTLWQLLPRKDGRGAMPVGAVTIEDAPRFPWRGLMLDSARHYQSPELIRAYLDAMALHKLNVLHWHLVDDQAWRLEIKKYPALTAVGAQRVAAGAATQADLDPITLKPRMYGGYYTQQTVRELVAYAAERGITIVPEIEMPGHAAAVFVAYPQFAASAHPPKVVPADWGIYADVYNVDDATFGFLEDVLTEVMALFPSRYIHVGGDEVQATQWAQSPAAQARMRELGLSDPNQLQHYFAQRIGKFLDSRGRRLVGWDEILAPGMSSSAVVMSWRGVQGAIDATARGNDSVLSPWPTLYFDNRQGLGIDEPPGRTHVISLEGVYAFEPAPVTLGAEQQRHVLGLQGAVWTEHIRTEQRVATMTFPRAAAIAELGWSQPARRSWADFLRRLPAQFERYEALTMAYSDSAFAVLASARYDAARARASVGLSNQTGFGEIRYTLDGSVPTGQSDRYREPLELALPSEIRAATFSGTQRVSAPRTFAFERELAQRRSSRELKLCSENIGLSLEDDAPVQGERAVFDVDIMNPCWIFSGADLDAATAVEAAVGQVPFNFQIGDEINKIRFPKPVTTEGELEVHLDSCDGAVLARLPLAPATRSQGVTLLPRAELAQGGGRHDLCLRFAQPGLDPLYVLDWVRLIEPTPAGAER